ncbi:MAG: dihydropteroate synthase [Bacteroidetes bacterium]|nr:dihydropteroate synthase [Bacteroidota bacterium]MBS1632728.1 dihydropteroate synthase [Bacteroidota bacterium]
MFELNCKGRVLLVDKPLVMGVINVTSDSFYPGSRKTVSKEILKTAEQMLKDGADLLDIGGQSTRPGSDQLPEEEELTRVVEPITEIHKNFPTAFISIDTFYSRVAKESIAAGACMVNDISAGSIDKNLIPVTATLKVPYVLMHMQGIPKSMQKAPYYENVVQEVFDFFKRKLKTLKEAGIKDIIIDPGFGFGKTIEHNFELLRSLKAFNELNLPLMAGLSRKSFLYKSTGGTPEDALSGTIAMNTIALLNGAHILRVHDVKEARQTVQLFQAYEKKKG